MLANPQFADLEGRARQFTTVSENIYPVANEITRLQGADSHQRKDDLSRKRNHAGTSVQKEIYRRQPIDRDRDQITTSLPSQRDFFRCGRRQITTSPSLQRNFFD